MALLPARTASRIQATIAKRLDTSITLRRGSTTLAAQSVALAWPSAGRQGQTDAAQATGTTVEVWGVPDLDIAQGDRFTWGASVCEIVLVRPDRTLGTVADATVVA